MVKVWKCYLWFFTVIWSKYSASKVSLSMEVAMCPWGVVNKWDFKGKRCWEPFQRLRPGSDHRRQTSSWCPRQGSSSWSEERPEQIGLQLIENWKTQTNKYGKPLRSSGPLLQSGICWKRRTCWSRTCRRWCWNLHYIRIWKTGLYFLSFSRMTSTSGKSAAGILCSSCSFK